MLGVTAVLLTCSYRGQEFIRVGYYVNNELPGEENASANLAAVAAHTNISPAVLAAMSETGGAAAAASSSSGAAQASAGTGEASTAAASSATASTAAAADDDDMDEDEEAVVEGIEVDNAPIAKRTGPVDPALVVRNILAAKPRVTRFQIQWD